MDIERLSPEDLMMLWPDHIWPQDVGVIALLGGADLFDNGGDFRIEAIRQAVAARLDRQPMYLAGAPLLELIPVIPLIGKISLGVGAMSYAGQFNIGVVADRDAHPDLEVLVSAMTEELHANGLSTRLAEVA